MKAAISSKFRIVIFLLSTILVIAFQNCNGGFDVGQKTDQASKEGEVGGGSENPPPPPPPPAGQTPCSKFKPGNYLMVDNDETRNINGIPKFRSWAADSRFANFVGYVFNIRWGTYEKSQGVYDDSEIEAALEIAAAHNKMLWVHFYDRTFLSGCNSKFLPSYVEREKSAQDWQPNACYATVWKTATMDHLIRVLSRIASRYNSHPNFGGIAYGETSFGIASFYNNPNGFDEALLRESSRLYAAIRQAGPTVQFYQSMNWKERSYLNRMTDALITTKGGISWPDSVVAERNNWTWYDLGKVSNKKLLIAPHAETPFIGATPYDQEQIYRMLNEDIGAHMIVWQEWHGSNSNYLLGSVIPTINKFEGKLNNTSCPF